MHNLAKNRLATTYISLILAFALLGGSPHCIALKKLKILCPGCGTYDMFRLLLQQQWEKAFHANPFMFVAFPILILLFLDYSVRWIRNKPQTLASRIPFAVYALLYIAFLGFGLERILFLS